MKGKRPFSAVIALCALCGLFVACQHSPSVSEPALLVITPSHATCLQQIESIMTRDLGGPVELTHAAFAKSDRLRMGPAELLDAQGRPLQGRLRGQPEGYRLSKNQNACQLQRDNHADVRILSSCQCRAVKPG
ncbi:MAG: hypothetical protein EAZ37_02375 [Burkholderiales bacterium]|nr:MAG: hypothetical protein EAZ37_02375 [Burkholderiales bacterium]